MALNEDRDKSLDKTYRIILRNARHAHAAAQERVRDADRNLVEALEVYRKHFGMGEDD